MSEIWTHKQRYCRGESEEADTNCPFCIDESEAECHFLFRCKNFDVFRPCNLKNVEQGCQPSILCRIFNDERRNARCIKQLAWFISEALDKGNKCIQGANIDVSLKCLLVVKMRYH